MEENAKNKKKCSAFQNLLPHISTTGAPQNIIQTDLGSYSEGLQFSFFFTIFGNWSCDHPPILSQAYSWRAATAPRYFPGYRRKPKPFHPSFPFLIQMISDSLKQHTSLHLHRKTLVCQLLVRLHVHFEFNPLALFQSILMTRQPSQKSISNLQAIRPFHSPFYFSHLRLSQNYQLMPPFPRIFH